MMRSAPSNTRVVANPLIFIAIALAAISEAPADTTRISIADASQNTSRQPVILNFPIARNGDKGYDVVFNYHTVDVSALAGIDYTATSGTITLPAGIGATSIPVTIASKVGTATNQTFQIVLDNATGIGPHATFGALQPFTVGTTPYSVAVADINGDGKPDLIVADLYGDYGHTVSLLLNTSAPGADTETFAPQQTLSAGYRPISVAVSDLNGDGRPDIVIADENESTANVLINTTVVGDSTVSFEAQQVFLAGQTYNSDAYSVEASDLNGDGKPDLVVTNFNDATVTVLINTTTPGATTLTFAAAQTFATGLNPWHVAVADVNGDGKPDLITANYANDTLSVLLNTTDPGSTTLSFAPHQEFVAGNSNVRSVLVADINGDGKPDLIATDDSETTVSVLLNITPPGSASASFSNRMTFEAAENFGALAVADVNGDGKPDVIVADSGKNDAAYVLLNTTPAGATTPRFAAPQPVADGGASTFLTAADINGDGKLDLIVANLDVDTVSVLLNTTAPPSATVNFADQQKFATGTTPNSVAAADINGDGIPDLLVANLNDNTVSVHINATIAGADSVSLVAPQTLAAGVGAYAVIPSDINGDGLPDLVVANYTPGPFPVGTVSVLLNTTIPGTTTASFAAQKTFNVGGNPTSVGAADVNGDGKPDLIVCNDADNTISVLLDVTPPGAVAPSFASQQTFATGVNPASVTTADINGDGKPDVIVANQGYQAISVLLNTTTPGAATPSFSAQQTFTAGSAPFGLPFSVTTADINGDGQPDLIVADYSSSDSVEVLLNTTTPGAATASFAPQQSFFAGFGPEAVTAADVDGDGKPDLIVANTGGYASLLLNTTPTGATLAQFATAQPFTTGTAPRALVSADLNGDGRVDVIVANQNSNDISVLLNTQYRTDILEKVATGTIVHDFLFADGFNGR